MVFLLTHGWSGLWRRGAVHRALAKWAASMLVTAVHLMPQELWRQTLATTEVTWHPYGPARSNGSMAWTESSLGKRAASDFTEPGTVAVPVLELGEGWLRRWSRLASGTVTGPVTLPAVIASPSYQPPPTGGPLSAADLVNEFRASRTPTALRAGRPLGGRPVDRRGDLGGSALHAEGRPEPTWSRCCRATSSHPTGPPLGQRKPGAITYEFVDGVRERLLSLGQRDRTIAVMHLVEDILAASVPAVRGLGARIRDPRQEHMPVVDPADEPYVQVELTVYQALSGPHLVAARRLRHALGVPSQPRTGTPSRKISIRPCQRSSPCLKRQSSRPSTPTRRRRDVPDRGTSRGSAERGHEQPAAAEPQLHGPARPARRAAPPAAGATPPRCCRRPARLGWRRQVAARDRVRLPAPEGLRPDLVDPGGAAGADRVGAGRAGATARLSTHRRRRTPRCRWCWTRCAIGRPPLELAADLRQRGVAEDVQRFFPDRGPGSIVVTSRNPEWTQVANGLGSTCSTAHESIELLRKRSPALSDRGRRPAGRRAARPAAGHRAGGRLPRGDRHAGRRVPRQAHPEPSRLRGRRGRAGLPRLRRRRLEHRPRRGGEARPRGAAAVAGGRVPRAGNRSARRCSNAPAGPACTPTSTAFCATTTG